MSTLIVEVCEITDVIPHPKADRMDIAIIKGWRCCIGKGQFAKGDQCVYLPPDVVLPVELSDRLGVTKYCSPVKNDEGVVTGARIKVARLRGEPSYGFPMNVENPQWPVGFSVVDHYGLTKWEPPLDCTDGDSEREHPAFHKYFTLENINNFPDVIKDGEEVIFTEKIHGKNCRVGLIRDTKEDGSPVWRFMAGSHDVRRKEMQTQRKRRVEFDADGMAVTEEVMKPVRNEKGKIVFLEDGITPQEELVTQEKEWFYEVTKRSQFFEALDRPGIKDLLLHLCNGQHNVVVFGEIYGTQDMLYGLTNGHVAFRVFDITVDGKYLNVHSKLNVCNKFKVVTVPELYRGAFSTAKVAEYVTGPTTLCSPEKAGAFKGREGIVITTVEERTANTPQKFFDRAALKAISFEYLERKNGTELH